LERRASRRRQPDGGDAKVRLGRSRAAGGLGDAGGAATLDDGNPAAAGEDCGAEEGRVIDLRLFVRSVEQGDDDNSLERFI
jgi:hypothetical protein